MKEEYIKIKFMQIAVSGGRLFALDKSGDLWTLFSGKWEMCRMPKINTTTHEIEG